MKLDRMAAAVGKGLFAGAVGTAAMTVSSRIEARLRHREPSSVPSDAAGKLLGVQPRNPAGKARFSNVVHWSYGISWGAARGLLGAVGVSGPTATAGHFIAVFGAEQVMLPRLHVMPPLWKAAPGGDRHRRVPSCGLRGRHRTRVCSPREELFLTA